MYKYETHMHTAEASACSRSGGAEMADKYKAEGYTGIIVTDHFFNGNSAVPRDLPWKKRIELYCRGYENAKKRGDEIGLDVFFGIEYGDGCSDFLVYGLDRQWLIAHDYILEMELTRFLELARNDGAMIIQAHPFRERDYIRGTVHAPRFIDGIEAYNAGNSDPAFDERARIYAGWYGLPVTSGSDAHSALGGKYLGVLSERKFTSALDYARAVANREIVCIEG